MTMNTSDEEFKNRNMVYAYLEKQNFLYHNTKFLFNREFYFSHNLNQRYECLEINLNSLAYKINTENIVKISNWLLELFEYFQLNNFHYLFITNEIFIDDKAGILLTPRNSINSSCLYTFGGHEDLLFLYPNRNL